MPGSMIPISKLNLVIDTNVLLVSVPSKSSYHWLYQAAILQSKLNIFVTTEILSEYEEILSERLSPNTSANVIRTLLELDNVFLTTVHFQYRLIESDSDDDKFVNCAINANAHFIITHDKHFNVLTKIDFLR